MGERGVVGKGVVVCEEGWWGLLNWLEGAVLGYCWWLFPVSEEAKGWLVLQKIGGSLMVMSSLGFLGFDRRNKKSGTRGLFSCVFFSETEWVWLMDCYCCCSCSPKMDSLAMLDRDDGMRLGSGLSKLGGNNRGRRQW